MLTMDQPLHFMQNEGTRQTNHAWRTPNRITQLCYLICNYVHNTKVLQSTTVYNACSRNARTMKITT